MNKLPDHYPAWWCCPVGKPRVVKDMEPKVEAPVRIDTRTWLTPGGVRVVESIGLVPPGSAEP